MAISGDWTKLGVLLLTLLVGGGAKLASLDALFRIRNLEHAERTLARVEADALRLSLAIRMDNGSEDPATLAQRLVDRLERMDGKAFLDTFSENAAVRTTVVQLDDVVQPTALPALIPLLARPENNTAVMGQIDSVALVAAAAADSVHAASAVRIEGLWQRVLALGGAAIVAFVLTSLGGSTWAALASSRFRGVLVRVEEYAKRLRQADDDKKRAVAAAELAAIARTEERAADAMKTLSEALALAEADHGATSQARAEAEASLGMTREMLTTLTNHLQAPLDGIREMAATMKVGTLVTKADRERIESLEMSGDSLEHLAQAALDLVRLDKGTDQLAEEPFRPEMLLETVIAATADAAHRRGLAVRLVYADESAERQVGDPGRIARLVETLLRDAIDATPKGEIVLESEDSPSGLRISVLDGGVRPSPTEAAAAFSATGANHRPARAVALALAKRLGGAITAEPGDRRGSHVHLILPLQRPAPAQTQADNEPVNN